ncbi:uncharacterized protein LOC115142592 [Oncorhynchus nerka]|uniref:uncharacterized protein LOC115142592 n=1 Tax=Oncorhynchus nerka TaxID=8023 RepID=UPI0031B83998
MYDQAIRTSWGRKRWHTCRENCSQWRSEAHCAFRHQLQIPRQQQPVVTRLYGKKRNSTQGRVSMSRLKLQIQKQCQSPETDKRGWSGQKHPALFGPIPNTSGVGLSGIQKGERGRFFSMPGAEDSARLPGHWRDVREWSIEKRPSHRMWVQDVEHVLGSTARQLCASLDKYPHHEPGDGQTTSPLPSKTGFPPVIQPLLTDSCRSSAPTDRRAKPWTTLLSS